MAKQRASQYRGPNSRKVNKAKRLEKQKRGETRSQNQLKKMKMREDMKQAKRNYKLKKMELKNERLKINKVADNIKAGGAAVAENAVPSITAVTASNAVNKSISDDHVTKDQIDQLINSGVKRASTDNEEEVQEKDFNWR